ncbi:MAG: ParB-like nuclease domain-containing protein [Candidatus Lokiarchaeota archaeon]|nr:ParB-like nuclease domain-containing protein [Candidatus Lokiarchaeota archaeon]
MVTAINNTIKALVEALKSELATKPVDEQVSLLNELRGAISAVSPFKEPVDTVTWVPIDRVQANTYNPNKVATPEMKLLHESIRADGYTQPIVAYKLPDGNYEIVDGFHRNRVGKEFPDIKERIKGYLPVVVIDKPLDERMGSTIRHNRARGTHQIRSMSDIVLDLAKQGWNDEKIMEKLGMSLDEVVRLKQVSGLKEAFSNHEFSKSWEEFEIRYFPAEKGVAGKTVARKRKPRVESPPGS